MSLTQSEIDRGEEDQLYNECMKELEAEVARLEYMIQDLESEVAVLDWEVKKQRGEVDRLIKLLSSCYTYAREAGDRIVEITEEFADE